MESRTTASRVLLLLLVVDAAYVLVHFVHIATPYLPSTLYSIEVDGGFAEWFQYAKELWAVILLGVLWRKTARPWAIGWMLLFAYFFLDDVVSVHEMGGDIAYRHLGLGPALGFRALDFGELLVTGLAAAGLFTIIAVLYRRSTSEEQVISRDLLLLALVLVTFGVGLDMIHSTLPGDDLRRAMGMIEDGGEMVTMSVACWYLLTVTDRGGVAPVPSLVERARTFLRL